MIDQTHILPAIWIAVSAGLFVFDASMKTLANNVLTVIAGYRISNSFGFYTATTTKLSAEY